MSGAQIGTPVLSMQSHQPANQSVHLPGIVEHREEVLGDMPVPLVEYRREAN